LIHALKDARNELIDVEDLSDSELAKLQSEFVRLRTTPAENSKPPASQSTNGRVGTAGR